MPWYGSRKQTNKKKELKSRVEKTKHAQEESTEGVSENFQLVAAAQHMMLLWHWLNPSPDVSQNKTTFISSVIPQPCNLRICVWQRSQLCFQKKFRERAKLLRVKQTCSYQDSEMRNQSQQITGNGPVGPREEETHLKCKLIAVQLIKTERSNGLTGPELL